MKYIKIRYTNGAEWGIPLSVIADNRAKYYAENDPDTTYQEEYDYVMRDSYEGIDWFQNQMNWDECQPFEITKPHFDPRDLSEVDEYRIGEK